MRERGIATVRSFGRGFVLFARESWRSAAVLALMNLAAALLAALTVTATSEVAWAQRDTIFADGGISDRGLLSLLLQLGLPFALVLALLSAAGFVALAAVLGDGVRRGAGSRPIGVFRALALGVHRALPFAGAFAIMALELVAAVLLAPFISLAGLVLLAVRGVRALLRRRAGDVSPADPAVSGEESFSWFSWPRLLAIAVPFGLAALILVHSLLILPVAAHEQRGVRGILRRASELTHGRALRVAVLGIGGAALYLLLVVGITSLPLLGVPQGVVTALLLLAQFTVAAVPVALLVVAYFDASGGRVPPGHAIPVDREARSPIFGAVASSAAAALVLGFLVAAPPQVSWAEALTPEELATAEETQNPSSDSEAQAETDGTDTDAGAGEGDPGSSDDGPVEKDAAAPEPDAAEPAPTPSGEQGSETPAPGATAPGGVAAPAWWNEGRPDPDGEPGARKFGSAECFESFDDYEDQWGVINKPTVSMCVDSLGDAPDAVPGDGWCETADGGCTLRAALEELSEWRSGHPGVCMANVGIAAGTVHLTAPLVATTRFELHGSQHADGSAFGSRLTIDGGQHGVQLFRITTGSGGGAELNGLTLTNGYAPSGAQGGAVQVLAGSALLQDVTLDNNYAADAGAANAVYGSGSDNPGTVGVGTSTFVNNGVPACYAPGFSVETWSGPTTIDADDPSCPGTTSSSDSVATQIDLNANPSDPKRGGPVTYWAHVEAVQAHGTETLAGTVTFYADGEQLDTVNVPHDGWVSTVQTAPGRASYTLRAVYSGSTGYRASQSQTTVTTNGSLSSVALAAESDTSGEWYRGHPLTLTATVDSGTEGQPATGTVTFVDGSNDDVLGAASVHADGTAVLETALPSGDGSSFNGELRWNVRAEYSGDADTDTDPAVSELLWFTLAPDATVTTLTPSIPSASPGQEVVLTARVLSQHQANPLTNGAVTRGSVSFDVPGGPITRGLDAQGEAQVTVPSFDYGVHQITASYEDDGWNRRYTASHDEIALPVTGQVDSAVSVTRRSAAPPTNFGSEVEWRVSVGAAPGVPGNGLPAPTGEIRLMRGTDVIAVAEGGFIRTSDLPIGANTELRIEYAGDGVYRPSSQATPHAVRQIPTTINHFARSASHTVVGQPVTFEVGVRENIGVASQDITEGTVRISWNGSTVATIDLAETTTVTVPMPQSLSDGTPLLVSYGGTEHYATTSYVPLTHSQVKATAEVTLALEESELPYTGTVRATATVTGAAPTTLAPSGQVQLYRGGVAIPGTVSYLAPDGTARFELAAE